MDKISENSLCGHILADYLNGKTDLKTAQDRIIQTIDDLVEAISTARYNKPIYFATKEVLEKIKDTIPPDIDVCEIPSSIDAKPFKSKIVIVDSKPKPFKFAFEEDQNE